MPHSTEPCDCSALTCQCHGACLAPADAELSICGVNFVYCLDCLPGALQRAQLTPTGPYRGTLALTINYRPAGR